MKSIIVGTAGHIDHGKTALVKALTGIDADRLQEEKRRGITIDLGFAHLELSGPGGETLRFGFVDVPGHERFVRNMLAGAGGIDLVLLVIAADEGIKPQTREHFDICRLLGIQHGITVLTKSDLVDSETLEVVRLEIADFLRGSFLEPSTVLPVSSLKGTGLEHLKSELVRIAAEIPGRDSSAITRLPIDRVFTMKGFGTVVTGTLVAGTIRKEDKLALLPADKAVRVRGVQVHGKATETAVAGERTAVNLAGIEKIELERGMVLSAPNALITTARLDVKLSLLDSAKPLRTGSRIHFHAFTSEAIGTVILHAGRRLEPGADTFAQVRLTAPLLLVPGDHFIIRQFSPVITIGGGVVLDSFPRRKAAKAHYLDFLNTLAGSDAAAILKAHISGAGDHGLPLAQAVALTGWKRDIIESYVKQDREIVRTGTVLTTAGELRGAMQRMTETLGHFHQQNPLIPGVTIEALHDAVGAGDSIFGFALDSLLRAKKVETVDGSVRLAGRSVVLKDEEIQSRKIIEAAFASAGLKVPALKDVLAGLKIDTGRAQKIVTLLLREKVLIKVSDDLVFHQTALADLRKNLSAEKARSRRMDVARFKDLTGVSRKYAIPLLEYLDRERITRREGDQRVIL